MSASGPGAPNEPAGHLPLGEGAEFDAIRTMLFEWGTRARGIGDDAAVLDLPAGERLVASTDASVDGVHFRREWLTAEQIGGRSAAAALSDLAAMAATPVGMLIALAVPQPWLRDLRELARGIGATADLCGCPIVGGNLSRATELSLTITVLGAARRPLSRSGARPGDVLYVTGRLGGPGAALRAFRAGGRPSPADLARFVAPLPRLREARWLAERGAHAAIDISDGLLADAAHLARASAATLEIDLAGVPRGEGVSAEEAAASGEEYELLVAMPPATVVDVPGFVGRFGCDLTAIGRVKPLDGAPVLVDGRPPGHRGYDHFG